MCSGGSVRPATAALNAAATAAFDEGEPCGFEFGGHPPCDEPAGPSGSCPVHDGLPRGRLPSSASSAIHDAVQARSEAIALLVKAQQEADKAFAVLDKEGDSTAEYEAAKATILAGGKPALSKMSSRTKELLALDPAVPAPVVAAIAKRAKGKVALACATRPDCPPDALLRFASLTDHDSHRTLKAVLDNPACPDGAHAAAAETPDQQFRKVEVLLTHPSTPPDVVEKCANTYRERTYGIDEKAAKHPNASPELLVAIVNRNINSSTGSAPLSNPAFPSHMLERLLDNRRLYRPAQRIAANPACPPHILERIFNDHGDDQWVRRSLVANPATPDEIRSFLTLSEG